MMTPTGYNQGMQLRDRPNGTLWRGWELMTAGLPKSAGTAADLSSRTSLAGIRSLGGRLLSGLVFLTADLFCRKFLYIIVQKGRALWKPAIWGVATLKLVALGIYSFLSFPIRAGTAPVEVLTCDCCRRQRGKGLSGFPKPARNSFLRWERAGLPGWNGFFFHTR